jgi:hypothetical protein
MKKRLSVYLEEGINQNGRGYSSAIIYLKLNQELCGEQNQNWH